MQKASDIIPETIKSLYDKSHINNVDKSAVRSTYNSLRDVPDAGL